MEHLSLNLRSIKHELEKIKNEYSELCVYRNNRHLSFNQDNLTISIAGRAAKDISSKGTLQHTS